MSFQIISDSSCDLGLSVAQERGIHLVPFYVSFYEQDYKKELYEQEISDLYRLMLENPGHYPKTSLPSMADYVEAFSEILEAGQDILCICLSVKFTGSYNAARGAADILLEKYTDRKIEVVDSALATILQGALVLEAARMRDHGLSLEEAVGHLERIRDTGRIFFTIGDLEYLIAGGRIGKALGAVGSTLKVRPLLTLQEGELFPAGLARNRASSLKKITEQVCDFLRTQGDIRQYTIMMAYSHDRDEAESFLNHVRESLSTLGDPGEIKLWQIGATIGVHIGPSAMGIGILKRYDA